MMMSKIGKNDQQFNAFIENLKIDEDCNILHLEDKKIKSSRNFVSGERACGREQMEGCGLCQRQGI